MIELADRDVAVATKTKIFHDVPSFATDGLLQDVVSASAQPVDNGLKLAKFIENARLVHRQSKASAANAAVLTYLVYLGTRDAEGAKWLKAQLECANDLIKRHNVDEVVLKGRAADFKVKGKAMFLPATTDAEADIQASEAAKLAELTDLTDNDWARRQKVEIGARAGTADWTRVVKLVLDLHSAWNASVVNRYSTVVGWLAARFPDAAEGDLDAMVKAIADAGGFDAVYGVQVDRQKAQLEKDDGSDDGSLTSVQVASIAKAKAKMLADGIKATVGVSVVPVTAMHASEGYTMLLARVDVNGVEVLGEAKATDAGIKQAVERMALATGCKTNAGAEFLWTLFWLGDLVTEGQSTTVTRHDLAAAETLKTERKVVLRDKEDGSGYEIVVSARYADASIVVTGYPSTELVRLGPPKSGLLTLTKTSRDNLYEALSSQFDRSILDVVAIDDPVRKDGAPAKNSPAWQVNYRTDDVGDAIAQHRYFFNDIADSDHRPLCVEGFKPHLLQNLKKTDLAAMYQQRKNGWEAVKKADKAKKTVLLAFGNGQMTLKIAGETDFSIAITGAAFVPTKVTLRAQEFFKVLGKLAEINADDLTLEVDVGGLLRFSWSDKLGHYSVSLPTATTDGSLSSRRLQQMMTSLPPKCDVSNSNA